MNQPGVVVVAPEVAIHPLSRQLLLERLAASPPEVTGVGAPLEALAPGSSAPCQAEWAAADPAATLTTLTTGTTGATGATGATVGAVALRPGIEAVVEGWAVTVATGLLGVDGRTRCYAATALDGAEPGDAGPQARPPFRRRPVALFLAGRATLPGADQVRDLVDALVDLDVEARLATWHPLSGPSVTRSCAPTQTSWEALAPEVVVLLDDEARDLAERWCRDRGTVFVAWEPELGLELVSWTVGSAQGRLRARIGPQADPAALAHLVNRLCSGPQPEPPTDPLVALAEPTRRRPVTELVTEPDQELDDLGRPIGPRPAARRVAVTATLGAGRAGAGLADQLEATGHHVRIVDDEQVGSQLADVELLVVGPGLAADRLEAWRRAVGPGPAAVVDLSDADLTDADLGAIEPAVRAAGQVRTDRAEVAAAGRTRGWRVQLAPPLLTRARVDELLLAGRRRPTPPAPRLGWWLSPLDAADDDAGDPDELAVRTALAEAVVAWLAGQPEAEVELVSPGSGAGPLRDLAPELADHARVRVRQIPPDAGGLAAWTARLWSPPVPAPTSSLELLEAGLAGVPTLTAATVEGSDPELVPARPQDPASWLALIDRVSGSARGRERARDRARDRAVALRGPDAAATAANRFVTWAVDRSRP